MKALQKQLRQVLRRLGRAPLFTVVTLVTVAAGVGANTVVFSVLEGVLLKPLPYPHSEELVGVWHAAPGINIPVLNMAPSHYFIYREQGQTFQTIGMYQHDSVSVVGLGEPEQVPAIDATEDVLSVLGVQPLLGRAFRPEDCVPKAAETAVLTYGYWRSKFGGESKAVGQTLVIDGKERQIIGVLPRDFHFLDERNLAMFLPLHFDRNKMTLGNYSYEGLARLKPGVTLQQANADVARLLPIVMNSFPPPPGFSIHLFEDARVAPNVRPLKQDIVGDIGNALWVLMGSIGLVLLIACANVANLLLVRTEGRRHELALRAALGSSWQRIAGELLLESVILGLLGSVLGLGLAYGALRVLVAIAPTGLPRLSEIGINGPVLLFTLAASLLASLLFGCVPILKYAGARLTTGIREGGRGSSQSREQHRARNTLVVIQVALALVLLVCSGLMIRTFRAMTHVNLGFTRPAELQSLRIYVPESHAKEPEQAVRMQEAILRKLEALPGVSSAGISTKLPMDSNGWHDPILLEGHAYVQGEFPPLRLFRCISPGYLKTVGTPLIAGRDLTWTDIYNKIPVAIVSENLAREYWQEPANALGKRIRVATQDDWREVIGVVGDVHDEGPNKKPPTSVYWPLLQAHFESDDIAVRRDVAFLLRTSRAGSQAFLKNVREAVWSVDANLPLADVQTLDDLYRRSMARTSFTLTMLAVAGSMALLLGVVGIYGVIAYSVSQRTREIGIRMALGAQSPNVTGMFVKHGLVLTGIGVACGVVAAVLLMRLMSSLLFNVSPIDPLTYASVSTGLAATAWIATYVPSRRAATVDPVEALRAE